MQYEQNALEQSFDPQAVTNLTETDRRTGHALVRKEQLSSFMV